MKIPSFWPQLSWNQPDSALTFRTQINSLDVIGTAGLCLLVRYFYRKYKPRQIPPQDEERQPLLRTPEEITRLNQESQHLKSELNQITQIISPEKELKADKVKQEVARLKHQELALQIREARAKWEQLLTEAKTKAGNSVKTIDLLLEAYQQKKQATENSQKDKLSGKIEVYQEILSNTLTHDEVQNLLNQQTELRQLEKHLNLLQINQESQALQIQPAYGTASSSHGGSK